MGIKSFWLSKEVDEKKFREAAKKNDISMSKLINNILKKKYPLDKKR